MNKFIKEGNAAENYSLNCLVVKMCNLYLYVPRVLRVLFIMIHLQKYR